MAGCEGLLLLSSLVVRNSITKKYPKKDSVVELRVALRDNSSRAFGTTASESKHSAPGLATRLPAETSEQLPA